MVGTCSSSWLHDDDEVVTGINNAYYLAWATQQNV